MSLYRNFRRLPPAFSASLKAFHDTPMGLRWASHGLVVPARGTPMGLPWASHGFPMVFPWFSHGSFMGLPRDSHDWGLMGLPRGLTTHGVDLFRLGFHETLMGDSMAVGPIACREQGDQAEQQQRVFCRGLLFCIPGVGG